VEITRRDFFKASAAGGVAVAWGSFGLDLSPAYAETSQLKISRATEVRTICPYCAVGCSMIAYRAGDDGLNVKPTLIHIEGDPDSPVNGGTLCPKGASTLQLAVNQDRVLRPKVRKPGGTEWEPIDLNVAMDRIAERVKKTRDENFVETVTIKGADGKEVQKRVNHTRAIFSLGGATMDNEWNYVQAKLMRGLGVVAIENQARI
jgi:formate dehydrogenase major subunit